MLRATGKLCTWAPWVAISISALLPLSGAELQPVCSLEKPSALPGETIWAQAQLPNAGPDIRYEWTATAGKVLRSGNSVLWNLSGVQPGLYELSARLVTSSDHLACAAKLLVLEPADERGELGGALLLPKQREGAGKDAYGAYTYVLLPGPPPDASSRERYLAVLVAWQKLVPAIGKLENYYKRTQLNVTFVPVTTTNKRQETGEWLLSSYDYVRAALILHKFPAEVQRGPYLVTSTVPLTYGAPISRETLVQNLSGVPATMAGYWVESFLRQAAHDRFWLAPARVSFALRMRTLLEMTGESIGPVATAFSEFSKYFGWK